MKIKFWKFAVALTPIMLPILTVSCNNKSQQEVAQIKLNNISKKVTNSYLDQSTKNEYLKTINQKLVEIIQADEKYDYVAFYQWFDQFVYEIEQNIKMNNAS